MTKVTFNQLTEMFQNSNHCPNNTGGTPGKTAKTHLLAFLWFAGNKAVMRTVALLFDMSVSTFNIVLTRVLNFLMDLAPQVIRFPRTEQQLQQTAEEFQLIAGFPNVAGCIDGTYVNIRTPKHKIKSTYTNRHDQRDAENIFYLPLLLHVAVARSRVDVDCLRSIAVFVIGSVESEIILAGA